MNAEEFHHITSTPHLQPHSIVVGGFFFSSSSFFISVSLCMCYASLCGGRCIYSLVTTLNLCSRELWEFYVFKNKNHDAKARIMSSWIVSSLKLSSSSHVSCQWMTWIDGQEYILYVQHSRWHKHVQPNTHVHARPHEHTQPNIVSQRTMISWFLCM